MAPSSDIIAQEIVEDLPWRAVVPRLRDEGGKPLSLNSLNGANGMSDPPTPTRYGVAGIEGSEPDWPSDEGRSERAREANKFQIAADLKR